MVTAGVYLIARMHDLFLLSETAQFSVAVVGLVTLLISSFAALTQTDLKRILAYSTMSQIGYMFLALGVGAWSAAIFHLMTHAFFKALLFLCAGSVIMAIHHEQNIYKMGGLWKKLPIPFIGMLVGSAALAALPFSSGFYSKDAILLTSFEHPDAGLFFWCVAALAAFITTLYTVRMMMLVFFGEQKSPSKNPSSLNMTLPLVALSLLAVGGGWFGLNAVSEVLPDGGLDNQHHEGVMVWITAAVPIVGVIVGYLLYGGSSRPFDELRNTALRKFWTSGWGFDALYDAVVVKPFLAFAKANKNDVVDLFYQGVVAISRGLHGLTALTQTGHLRWYAANFTIGLIVVLVIVLGVR
jgi:NADH-quinone oxidoreductase subunit L